MGSCDSGLPRINLLPKKGEQSSPGLLFMYEYSVRGLKHKLPRQSFLHFNFLCPRVSDLIFKFQLQKVVLELETMRIYMTSTYPPR